MPVIFIRCVPVSGEMLSRCGGNGVRLSCGLGLDRMIFRRLNQSGGGGGAGGGAAKMLQSIHTLPEGFLPKFF